MLACCVPNPTHRMEHAAHQDQRFIDLMLCQAMSYSEQQRRCFLCFRYPKAASSSSPPPEQAVPPPDTEATLATQAAAQQMWESHAAAESDNTASTTPPPESPTQPTTATAEQQQPQPDTLHAMLEGLGNLAGNPPTNQQVWLSGFSSVACIKVGYNSSECAV